jgi:hypothetical protein
MQQRPPAVRFGIIRQLDTVDPIPVRARTGEKRTALVIGDPRGALSTLPELPGAVEEANLVATLLDGAGYSVTTLTDKSATPEAVVSALFAGSWDIIHIAGHGVHYYRPPVGGAPVSGVALGGDPLRVLDTRMLNQLQTSPDLVFVNCCLLGNIDPDEEREYLKRGRAALAGSVAVQLIRMGVRAVIAAGWEVDDLPAKTFAKSFYEGLLGGGGLGSVTRRAREATFEAVPNRSTWGAYQCYGDPDFRLRGKETQETKPPVLRFAAPVEALAAIERVAANAEVGGNRTPTADLDTLRQIEDAAAEHRWSGRADILAALGAAYRQ